MSAVVSEMLIRIAADTAQLRSQMEQAKAAVESSFGGMEKAVSLAKTALVAFAGVSSVKAFGDMIQSAVDAMGAMHDLSIQTGLSVAALQQFKSVGSLTETSIDSIAGATVKLSKAMSLADEDGKNAALAIKALGLNFAEFKNLSPEQQMLTVAQSLNKFQDGADKSAAAMMLFGKQGAQLLPFLKDLGDSADDINAKLTEQEKASRAAKAAMADAYGDNLTMIRKNSEGWKKDLAEGLLPAMYETSEAFLQLFSGSGGLRDQLKALVADGTIAEWGRTAVTALSYVVDGVQIALRGLNSLGMVIGGTVLAATYAMEGEFKKAGKVLSEIPKDIADQWGEKTLGAKFRERMADLKGLQSEAGQAREKLNLADVLKANEEAKKREEEATKAAAAAQKAAIAEYQRAVKAGQDLTNSIDAKNEALERELAAGRALTPVEKELLKLDQDLKNGKIALTKAEEAELRKKIQLGQQLEDEIDWRKQLLKAKKDALDESAKEVKSLEDQTKRQIDQNYALEYGKEALERIEIARLRDRAAILAETVAQEELLGVCNAETEAHKDTLAALQNLIAARERGVHLQMAKDAADEWKRTADSIYNGLTDSLYRAFEKGKGFFETLWDGIKNTFKTTILRLGVQAVMGMGANMLGIGSAAASGGGGGGAFGTLGTLANIGSMAKNIWSGGMNFLSGATTGNAFAFGADSIGSWLVNNTTGSLNSLGGSLMSNAGTIGTIGSYLGPGLAGIGIGSMIAGDKSIGGISGTGSSTIGAAIGAAVAGPIGAAIGGVLGGVVNAAFGRGPKEVTERGLTATFSGGKVQDGQMYSNWTQEGGWFRSDKSGTDYAKLTDNIQAMLDQGVGALYQSTKQYAEILNLPVKRIDEMSFEIRTKLTGNAEEDSKAITQALEGYQMAMVTQFKGFLEPLQHAGETLVETMQRLVVIQTVSEQLNTLGGAFGNFAHASIEARESIIGLVGGIDALIEKANGFVSNYYTANEQGGMTAKAVVAGLESVGFTAQQIAALNDRGDYRALLESIDVNTQAGQQQFAALLNMQQQYAGITQLMQDQKLSLTELASQAPVVAALDAMFDPAKETADSSKVIAENMDQANKTLGNILGAILNGNKISEIAASAAERAAAAATAAANTAATVAGNVSLAAAAPTYNNDLGA